MYQNEKMSNWKFCLLLLSLLVTDTVITIELTHLIIIMFSDRESCCGGVVSIYFKLFFRLAFIIQCLFFKLSTLLIVYLCGNND